ncbi:MAG: D-alanyl-D-alanine carboxypeptidase [Ruminococcaceae bacterium]|nr:D-alanyl-D-alanine carboxypeptidase [Oscillospiraceae bacterium]
MKRIGLILAVCILLSCFPVCARAAAPEVAAKSALLMDMATGTVLHEQNAHEKLPPASVTKVMTMLLVMEAIDDHRISWDDAVTVSEAAAEKGGSQIYLKVGETMSVADMVKSVAVSSANDCACALAEHLAGSEAAFVDKMNARAKELGMEDTHFVNCTGLDDAENAKEHLTSAYDIALMSRELMLHHSDIQKYTTIWMDTVRDGAFGLANTNKLIRFYPGATGLKTGFTAAAGYCLSATAQRDGLSLIAVVLGAKTSQERFAGCKAMLDYGFANYALITPQLPESNQVPVKLGTAGFVNAVPSEDPKLLLDKGQKDQVTTEVTLDESVTAPVSRGQKLGMLTIRAGEQVLSQVPMVAADTVPKLSWWELFIKVLQRISMSKSGG